MFYFIVEYTALQLLVQVSAADSTTGTDSDTTVVYSDSDSDSDGPIFFMEDSLSEDEDDQNSEENQPN